MQYKVSFGTDIAHRPILFEISSLQCLEILEKYFSLQITTQGEVSPFQVFKYFLKILCLSVCLSVRLCVCLCVCVFECVLYLVGIWFYYFFILIE